MLKEKFDLFPYKKGDRILHIIRRDFIQEIVLDEVSPDGKWVKYTDPKNQSSCWESLENIEVISVL